MKQTPRINTHWHSKLISNSVKSLNAKEISLNS